MRKSKFVFFVICAVVILAVLLVSLLSGRQEVPEEPAVTTAPETGCTAPIPSAHTTQPVITTYPSEELDIYTLSDNVRITQVEKDPNEVIDRSPMCDSSHPEYIAMDGGDQYFSVEGKVFRNDKVISIDLFDDLTGDTYTISFGYITGSCNRFLYLNPVIETPWQDVRKVRHSFHFSMPVNSSGSVLTFEPEFESEEVRTKAHRKADSMTVRRALDQEAIATYNDPSHPGTVWYTQTPIDGPTWIDVTVMVSTSGGWLANLRLYIDKAEDGTYSIVNLENRNLLQNNVSRLPDSELEYIYSIANDIIHDPEKIYCADIVADMDLPIEQFLMTWRDKTTDLYYPYFIPASDTGHFVRSLDMLDTPVIAVSCRKYSVDFTFTIYLQVVMEPIPGSHGIYQFIGYDMPMYHTISYLQSMGYPSDG